MFKAFKTVDEFVNDKSVRAVERGLSGIVEDMSNEWYAGRLSADIRVKYPVILPRKLDFEEQNDWPQLSVFYSLAVATVIFSDSDERFPGPVLELFVNENVPFAGGGNGIVGILRSEKVGELYHIPLAPAFDLAREAVSLAGTRDAAKWCAERVYGVPASIRRVSLEGHMMTMNKICYSDDEEGHVETDWPRLSGKVWDEIRDTFALGNKDPNVVVDEQLLAQDYWESYNCHLEMVRKSLR